LAISFDENESAALAKTMEASDIIISIRPKHAFDILAGRKTVEFRRRFPQFLPAGSVMLVYASSPEQHLIGAVGIEGVKRMTLTGLWRSYRERGCIARSLFDLYFSGAREGFGVMLGARVRFADPIPVSELRERFRFHPPQSYCYIRGSLSSLWKDERIQVPDRYKHCDRSGRQPSGRAH
jgi:predicted transcriptional regulator